MWSIMVTQRRGGSAEFAKRLEETPVGCGARCVRAAESE
jgi:hypothetical protein